MIEDYQPIYEEELNKVKEQLRHLNYDTKEFELLLERRNELEELEDENRQKFIDSKLDLPVVLSQGIFLSLEGECPKNFQTEPTVYFRTLGCNLACRSEKYPDCHCDSEYTFKESDTTVHTTLGEAIEKIKSFNCNHIAITGGEPLLHKEVIYWLLWHLSREEWSDRMRPERFSDYTVSIETNGTLDFSWVKNTFGNFVSIIGDWKCPVAFGKKANESMLLSNLDLYGKKDALKFVVTEDDFDEVIRVLEMSRNENGITVDKRTNVYVSPAWGCVDMRKLVDFILDNREKYKMLLSLQLHKLFDLNMKELMNLPSVKKSVDNIWN